LIAAEALRALESAAGAERRFAVIGAVARNAWAPPRATVDLDLCVAAVPGFLESAKAALLALGFSPARIQQADPADAAPDMLIFRSAAEAGLRQVDFLVAKTVFEGEVLRRAVLVEVAGRLVPVATPEDVVIYKLIANRPRDRDDAEAVARTEARAGRNLDWNYVARWVEEWGVRERFEALRLRLEG